MTPPPLLGDETPIDVRRLIAGRLLIQAASGGGKSYGVRRILEQTHGHVPQIVLDPEGEFHTLREKYDYILAGKGGDCPAEVKTAALLARRVLELRMSIIIDLYELGDARQEYVAQFLDSLVGAPRELWSPFLVVIDEAEEYAIEGDRGDCTRAVSRLMKLGRKRGFSGLLATQRISMLNKNAAAQCANRLVGRTELDLDQRRVLADLGMTGAAARKELRQLEPGTFHVYGPAFGSNEVKLVKIGPVQTTHPEPGAPTPAPTPPPAQVKAVLAQLADLPAEAETEARTSAELRARVERLEGELRATRNVAPPPPPPPPPVVVDRPILGEPAIARLEAVAARADELAAGVTGALEQLVVQLCDIRATINLASKIPIPAHHAKPPAAGGAAVVTARPTTRVSPAAAPPTGALDQQSIIDGIATLSDVDLAVTVNSLAAWLGVHPKTKTLLASIGALRGAGVLAGLELTAAGRDIALPTDPAPSPDDQRAILSRGLSESQRRILDTIATFEALGRPATHAAIAAWVGVHPKTKTLLEDVGKLRSRGFLDDSTLTEVGRRASSARFATMTASQLLEAVSPDQRRIVELALAGLAGGQVATMAGLAEQLGMHPKTKSLLTDLGVLRSRGLLANGWPLRPTSVFPGVA